MLSKRSSSGIARRAATVLAAAITAMTLVAPATVVAQTGETEPSPTSATTPLVEHATKIALPGELPGVVAAPWDLAVTPTAVWVLEPRAGQVYRIDPKTNRVVTRVKLPEPGCLPRTCPGIDRIVGNARDVWVVNNGAGSLVHIDARRNKVVGTLPIQAGAFAPPVLDADGVWTPLDGSSGDIARVDARTHEISRTVHVGVAPVWAVAVVDGTLWGAGLVEHGPSAPPDETLYRIDPATATVAAAVPGMSGAGVVVGHDLWLSRTCCPFVTRLDGRTGAPGLDINVDGGSIFQDAGGGSVWVRMFNEDRTRHWVTRIDASDGSTELFELPTTTFTGGIGYGHRSLWVTSWDANAVYRLRVPVR